MQNRKLTLGIATASYGGNGGLRTEHPDVGRWIGKTIAKAVADPRIDHVYDWDACDTPISMVRNAAVLKARSLGCDLLLQVDSDMGPDCELGEDPTAKPFFDSSFDYIYENYDKGPFCIAAPYCGPGPISNTYCFYFANFSNVDATNQPDMKLEQYSRAHAELMTGIQDAGALPTGLMLCDMRYYELTDPKHEYKRLLAEHGNQKIAAALTKPWHYYEWDDIYQAAKGSTEDVTVSRDLLLVGQEKLGYCGLKVNWDSWAAHHKALSVRKPRSIKVDHVNEKYRTAVLENHKSNEQLIDFKRPSKISFEELVGNGQAR